MCRPIRQLIFGETVDPLHVENGPIVSLNTAFPSSDTALCNCSPIARTARARKNGPPSGRGRRNVQAPPRVLRGCSQVGVMVLWKRWTETWVGRRENEKLLKTDQNWPTSVIAWRCVRVVAWAVVMVCGVLEGGMLDLATREAAFVIVVSVVLDVLDVVGSDCGRLLLLLMFFS